MASARGLKGLIVGTDGEALEAIADGLLRDSGELGKTIYTEVQLTRQDIRHAQQDSLERLWREQVSHMYNTDDNAAWEEVRAAAITDCHIPLDTITMIELRRDGLSCAQIGVRFKLTENAVQLRCSRAERKIKKLPAYWMWEAIYDMRRYLISNWWDVFREQIKARQLMT